MTKKICIIGAGPSGISMMKALLDNPDNKNLEIICYEKLSNWGGLWNYTWETGLDRYGEPVHGSMYRHLHSNGPKECLEFSDYSFDKHFGKPIPSFPPREVLYDYIIGRVKDSKIKEWIKFNHVVKYCDYHDDKQQFQVLVKNNITNDITTTCFDYVICCNGHFSTPNIPIWTGFESFSGRIIHSHDFRNAEEMKDKDILIIGTSYSAEDIASQCYKYGVKSVTLSWRTKPMNFKWPPNFITKPLLEKIENDICYFIDGSSILVDVIILCTGYLHSYPFLSNQLRLKTNNRLYPNMLWNGVVFINNSKLFYIGMQDQWFTFNMFQIQAVYIRNIIMGKQYIPPKNKMILDIDRWQTMENNLEDSDEQHIRFQAQYLKFILDKTDLAKFNIDGMVELFLEWEKNKHQDIMTFRDQIHQSVITNTYGKKHHTKWLKEYDDSLWNYCKL